MKSSRARRYSALILGVPLVYAILYFNGVRYGFSLAWIAMAVFGLPLFLWWFAMYADQGKMVPSPKGQLVFGLLTGLAIFVAGFDTFGWAGLVFPSAMALVWLVGRKLAGNPNPD